MVNNLEKFSIQLRDELERLGRTARIVTLPEDENGEWEEREELRVESSSTRILLETKGCIPSFLKVTKLDPDARVLFNDQYFTEAQPPDDFMEEVFNEIIGYYAPGAQAACPICFKIINVK